MKLKKIYKWGKKNKRSLRDRVKQNGKIKSRLLNLGQNAFFHNITVVVGGGDE